MMLLPARAIIAGVIAVVVFDAVAAFASRALGFPYASATLGSYLLYFAVGVFAARTAGSSPVKAAALAAAIAGLADASLGWWVSSLIGPGRPLAGFELTALRWAGVALFVVMLAAAIGTVGGLVGRGRTTVNVLVP
jgi:hypothetical protein